MFVYTSGRGLALLRWLGSLYFKDDAGIFNSEPSCWSACFLGP
jgi:hypothetical protein